MSNEKIKQARKICGMIQIDCQNDASALEGAPFTGARVAQSFGETLAMVQRLAIIMNEILEHVELQQQDKEAQVIK